MTFEDVKKEDTNADNINDQLNDTADSGDIKDTTQAPPVGADAKTKQGFFSKIAKTFFSNEDGEDAGVVDADTDEGDDGVNDFELTDEIKEAAKAAGWDDEKLQKYAAENPDALRLLALQYQAEPPYQADGAEVNYKGEEVSDKLDRLELSPKALDEMREQYGEEVVNNVISPLIEKLNKVVEVLDAQAGQSQAAQQAVNNVVLAEREKVFQQKLDMLDEQFPVFGKWENVPRDAKGQVDVKSPQFKARAEVWMSAKSLEQAGFDWDTALENSIAMYKGKHLESAVKRQVIKDLNGRKKQFTAQPSHKKTKPVKLEGKQAAIQAVREAAKQAGVTF